MAETPRRGVAVLQRQTMYPFRSVSWDYLRTIGRSSIPINQPLQILTCAQSLVLIEVMISDANEPSPLFRCRDDEIKSMRVLLVDVHRPREQRILAIDLRSDIFSHARLPNFSLRNERWCLLSFM
jgi:hypothetical protein